MSETTKSTLSADKAPTKTSAKTKPNTAVKATAVKVAAAKPATKPAAEPTAIKAGAKVPKTKPVKAEAAVSKKDKVKKAKLIRDSFTMPETDYAHIASIKARSLKAGVNAKKSEVLRAALNVLAKLSDSALSKALADLAVIKTGRPVKS